MMRGIGGVMLAVMLAGCGGGGGEVYDLPAATVRTKLMDTNLPFPLQGTSHAQMKTRKLPDGSIELALADAKGKAQLRFVAAVKEDGDRTRVAIDYAGAGDAYVEADAGMKKHPEIKAVYLKAVREQVDSQLEGRAFDNMVIGPEMMVAFAANAGSIVKDMKAAGDAYRRRDKANMDAAYAREAQGGN